MSNHHKATCIGCKGKGFLERDTQSDTNPACSHCNGTGKISSRNLASLRLRLASKKAAELGAEKPNARALNGQWAIDFPTQEAAKEFVKWLNENELEHRGIYYCIDLSDKPSVWYRS